MPTWAWASRKSCGSRRRIWRRPWRTPAGRWATTGDALWSWRSSHFGWIPARRKKDLQSAKKKKDKNSKLQLGAHCPGGGGIDCYRPAGGVRICPKRGAACRGKPDIVPFRVSARWATRPGFPTASGLIAVTCGPGGLAACAWVNPVVTGADKFEINRRNCIEKKRFFFFRVYLPEVGGWIEEIFGRAWPWDQRTTAGRARISAWPMERRWDKSLVGGRQTGERKKEPWGSRLGRICVWILVWPHPTTERNCW